MTLAFLGDLPDPHGPAVALRHLARRVGRTPAKVGPRTLWLGSGAWAAAVSGLDRLGGEAAVAFEEHRSRSEAEAFLGHLTLARIPGRAEGRKPAPLGFSEEMELTEITLVRSELSPSGARYRILAKEALRGT